MKTDTTNGRAAISRRDRVTVTAPEINRLGKDQGKDHSSLDPASIVGCCERLGHPRSQLAHDECLCGLTRYDD